MRYQCHVFVCENEREPGHPRGCCKHRGSEAITKALKEKAKQTGLSSPKAARRVRVNKSGCLDVCEHGPTLVIYPEGVWYGGVTLADVDEIFEEHLRNGRPVERLRLPDAPKVGKA